MFTRRKNKWQSASDFDPYDDPAESDMEEEEEEEEEDEEDEDDEDEDEENDDPKAKKFSQEDFNRAVAKARKSARSAARQGILEELGVKNVDEAKTVITGAKSGKEGKGKEDDSAAEDLKRENAKLKADLKSQETNGKIKDALVDAGLTAKAAAKALKLVELDESDPSDEEIEDAIEELKESMPGLFATVNNDEDEEEDDDRKSKKTLGTQPPAPKRKRKGASAAEQAASIFAQRHPQTTKS